MVLKLLLVSEKIKPKNGDRDFYFRGLIQICLIAELSTREKKESNRILGF